MTKARRRSVPIEPTVPSELTVPIERRWWPALALIVGTLLYLFLFYYGDQLKSWPSPIATVVDFLVGDLSQVNRIRRFALLLLPAPDVLVDTWVRDDWSRFGFLDHIPVLFGAAVILVVSYLTGNLLLELLRVRRLLTRLERIVLGTAAGLNAWSLLTLAIGLAGGLQQRWIFLCVGGLVIAATAWRTIARRQANGIRQVSNPPKKIGDRQDVTPSSTDVAPWLWRVAFWLSVPIGIFIILGGTLPATHFDVREYHLQVPKEWFLQGRVTFLPHNVYGNMPLGAEMHAVLGMVLWFGESRWWWGALVGKTTIAAMAPLTALGVYAAGRRYFSKNAGAIAAFMMISTPWTAFVSMNGLIDGASAFYSLVAVYAAMLMRYPSRPGNEKKPLVEGNNDRGESRERESDCVGTFRSDGLAALSGFLAGGGVACKYPALLFLVVPLFLVIFVRRLSPREWNRLVAFRSANDASSEKRTGTMFDLRAAVIFSVAVACGCGLWFGKNLVLTGNPTYPLLYRWFDGKSWSAEKDERWRHAHGPPHGGELSAYSLRELWNSAVLLVIRSDYLSPALLPLAVAGLFSLRYHRPLCLLLVLMLWTMAVWWIMTHRVDRFLVPILPFAALLAGVGADWGRSKLWVWAIVGILGWNGAVCFVYDTMPLVVIDNRFFISLREMRLDLPRGPTDQTRLHNAHRYLNEYVHPEYRALLVGEAQVFDLEIPILYNTCFDDCHFEQLLRGRSRDERLAALRNLRISHVFVYWYELDRYRSPGNYGYSGFATRDLIRQELVHEQGLLQPVPLELNPGNGEVLEVVGWRDW